MTPSTGTSPSGSRRRFLPQLTEGTKKVRIELWGREGKKIYGTEPLAAGSFKLEVGSDVAKVVKKIEKADEAAGEAREAAAKADEAKHLAAGERWVNFTIGFCFKSNPMFEWSHKNGSSGNAGSGAAMWLPIGAKVELCQDASRTGCRRYATVTDETDQRIDYECPHLRDGWIRTARDSRADKWGQTPFPRAGRAASTAA